MSGSRQVSVPADPASSDVASQPSNASETGLKFDDPIKGYYLLRFFCGREESRLLLDKIESLGARDIKLWQHESVGQGFRFSYTYADHPNAFSEFLNYCREVKLTGDLVRWILVGIEIDLSGIEDAEWWETKGFRTCGCGIRPILNSNELGVYNLGFTDARNVFRDTPKSRAEAKDGIIARNAIAEAKKHREKLRVKAAARPERKKKRVKDIITANLAKARLVEAKARLDEAQAQVDKAQAEVDAQVGGIAEDDEDDEDDENDEDEEDEEDDEEEE